MGLHRIEKEGNKLQTVQPSSFAGEQWLERQHLQPLLRDNPEAIDPELFIISEEFSNWEGSARRVDLLGLDRESNLVVIELKRVEEGGHMELQSIRYAAMLSAMDFEAVVRAHEAFLTKQGKDMSGARQSLRDFLELDDTEEAAISSTPRIILVAPSFSREITTTVLWLNDQGIPLPSASDYQIKIREKTVKAEREASIKRRANTINILLSQGVLKEGTRLHLIQTPRPGLVINEERAKHATFYNKGNQGVKWDYDENYYSLSGLCREICQTFGGDIGSGSFPGPDFWAIEGETVSLSERATALSAPPMSE
jgi:hypothetical protein